MVREVWDAMYGLFWGAPPPIVNEHLNRPIARRHYLCSSCAVGGSVAGEEKARCWNCGAFVKAAAWLPTPSGIHAQTWEETFG